MPIPPLMLQVSRNWCAARTSTRRVGSVQRPRPERLQPLGRSAARSRTSRAPALPLVCPLRQCRELHLTPSMGFGTDAPLSILRIPFLDYTREKNQRMGRLFVLI
ncbi:MAG TPA: hypothetical protein VHK27_10260, partial [Gammaproteobacteria bacterium]|nr:hypothetical protein [Gammaproteobacteria bacterium]